MTTSRRAGLPVSMVASSRKSPRGDVSAAISEHCQNSCQEPPFATAAGAAEPAGATRAAEDAAAPAGSEGCALGARAAASAAACQSATRGFTATIELSEPVSAPDAPPPRFAVDRSPPSMRNSGERRDQLIRLGQQIRGGSRRLFGHRAVLLGGVVQLVDAGVDLLQAVGLLRGGRGDFLHEARCASAPVPEYRPAPLPAWLTRLEPVWTCSALSEISSLISRAESEARFAPEGGLRRRRRQTRARPRPRAPPRRPRSSASRLV
jgi:hypothetical protein